MINLQNIAYRPSFEEGKNMLRYMSLYMSLYMSSGEKSSFRSAVIAIVFLAAITLALCAPAFAETKKQAPTGKQITFASYDEAVMALANAVQNQRSEEAFGYPGSGSESVVSSGDPVSDQEARENFIKRYYEGEQG